MNENVYKIIELAGSSKATIEEAVKNALSRASESLRDSRWFEVTQIRGRIVDNEVAFWQVGLKLGFALEGRDHRFTCPLGESDGPAGIVNCAFLT